MRGPLDIEAPATGLFFVHHNKLRQNSDKTSMKCKFGAYNDERIQVFKAEIRTCICK